MRMIVFSSPSAPLTKVFRITQSRGGSDQVVADFAQPGFDEIQLILGNAANGFRSIIHAEQDDAGMGIGYRGKLVGHAVAVGAGNPVATEFDGFQFEDRILAERYLF